MSGQAGGRGYLIQSLICVLDTVRRDYKWRDVTIEPEHLSEKVDILWTLNNGRRTAVQVRSSQNQIDKSTAEVWADQLRLSTESDRYELILVGPCSDSVASMGEFRGVKIPTPHSLNVRAMIEQAAHRLDAYFESKGIMRVPPFVRELLVEGLITRISTYASGGTPLRRCDLEKLLNDWVLSIYPEAVTEAVEMQCAALWNSVYIPSAISTALMKKPLVSPITFVNDGVRTCVIRTVRMTVEVDGRRYLYKPTELVDLKTLIGVRGPIQPAHHLGIFTEIAVQSGQSCLVDVLFEPFNEAGWGQNDWRCGVYRLELFAVFADRERYMSLREGYLDIDSAENHAIISHSATVLRFRQPELRFDQISGGEPEEA